MSFAFSKKLLADCEQYYETINKDYEAVCDVSKPPEKVAEAKANDLKKRARSKAIKQLAARILLRYIQDNQPVTSVESLNLNINENFRLNQLAEQFQLSVSATRSILNSSFETIGLSNRLPSLCRACIKESLGRNESKITPKVNEEKATHKDKAEYEVKPIKVNKTEEDEYKIEISNASPEEIQEFERDFLKAYSFTASAHDEYRVNIKLLNENKIFCFDLQNKSRVDQMMNAWEQAMISQRENRSKSTESLSAQSSDNALTKGSVAPKNTTSSTSTTFMSKIKSMVSPAPAKSVPETKNITPSHGRGSAATNDSALPSSNPQTPTKDAWLFEVNGVDKHKVDEMTRLLTEKMGKPPKYFHGNNKLLIITYAYYEAPIIHKLMLHFNIDSSCLSHNNTSDISSIGIDSRHFPSEQENIINFDLLIQRLRSLPNNMLSSMAPPSQSHPITYTSGGAQWDPNTQPITHNQFQHSNNMLPPMVPPSQAHSIAYVPGGPSWDPNISSTQHQQFLDTPFHRGQPNSSPQGYPFPNSSTSQPYTQYSYQTDNTSSVLPTYATSTSTIPLSGSSWIAPSSGSSMTQYPYPNTVSMHNSYPASGMIDYSSQNRGYPQTSIPSSISSSQPPPTIPPSISSVSSEPFSWSSPTPATNYNQGTNAANAYRTSGLTMHSSSSSSSPPSLTKDDLKEISLYLHRNRKNASQTEKPPFIDINVGGIDIFTKSPGEATAINSLLSTKGIITRQLLPREKTLNSNNRTEKRYILTLNNQETTALNKLALLSKMPTPQPNMR